jgi:hypothetical protein
MHHFMAAARPHAGAELFAAVEKTKFSAKLNGAWRRR